MICAADSPFSAGKVSSTNLDLWVSSTATFVLGSIFLIGMFRITGAIDKESQLPLKLSDRMGTGIR